MDFYWNSFIFPNSAKKNYKKKANILYFCGKTNLIKGGGRFFKKTYTLAFFKRPLIVQGYRAVTFKEETSMTIWISDFFKRYFYYSCKECCQVQSSKTFHLIWVTPLFLLDHYQLYFTLYQTFRKDCSLKLKKVKCYSSNNLYNKTRHSYIYMLPIAGQTAGPNGLTFIVDTQGCPGGFLG